MDNSAFTKSERKQLRELVGRAWDAELSVELTKLEVAFADSSVSQWRVA